MIKRITLAALLAASTAAMVSAGPLWVRDVAISPDGNKVAFTYKGDIYTVQSTGGRASQLTTNDAYDSTPLWSPDGKRIVFRSNREGSDDLYIVDAQGGTPRRLTTHSGHERPITFIDNATIIYQANMKPSREAIQGPFQAQAYKLNVDSIEPRPSLYMSVPVQAASIDGNGRLLYQDRKGFENIYRKHERSSGTADIWLVTPDGSYECLTDFNGHDLNPVWKQGTDNFFYLSEEGNGTLNVYERSVDGKVKRQLTRFEKHPVRSLSASDNGKLAFSWDGEAYTLAPGGEPKLLDIQIVTDDYDNDRVKRYITGGATNLAVSPSGNEVAFIVRGDIYVTNVKYKTTKRITNTPAQERVVDFAPDGRTLVYDSDRDGHWKLYTTTIVSPDEKEFAYATDLREELLYSCPTVAQQPDYSPDGKKVAFLENRTELRVIDVDTKNVTTALDGKYNYSYTDGDVSFEWSPDSRWLLSSYIGVGGWNNIDIALVAADGSKVVDLTESGYADYYPQWVLGGKGITYLTGKHGMKSHGSWGNQNDVILMMLDTEAWDEFGLSEEEAALAKKERERTDSIALAAKESGKKKKKKKDDALDEKKDDVKPLEFDLDNRRYRTRRLTGISGNLGSNYLSPDGDKFYYVASAPDGTNNLYVTDLREGKTSTLANGISGSFLPDKKGENLFMLSGSGISKIAIPGGDRKSVDFEAIYERRPSLEREYIYDHMWQQVKDKFYDVNLHGVDWEAYGEHYRRFLPHIDNNRDFSDLLSEILGELNASHTGSGTSAGNAPMSTASLGAFFDENYTGDGLLVSEVLPRSPLAARKAHVQPGDIILSINGKEIKAGHDYFPLLDGLTNRKTRLAVKRADGTVDEIVVKPISTGTESGLLYQRWVERNQAIVDSVSGGRVAYVHVQGMNGPSFSTVYDQLLGKYRNHEAVIVDTRYNGGGWLHNDLAQLLNGKEYVRFMPRGRYIGSEPFSQWYKPSVMLVNESNYSDAHGTPYSYQTLGIGDVVGAPIPGTMTAVWWETQIDPSIYFGIPQVTSQSIDGTVLENHQLNPDVLIYNNPADVQAGYDAQLVGATKHLLKKLDSDQSSK
ncbi:MAG: S41 family peptidase [Clostridiales bacterium]|nr:S41 family peptidase [Clostridiales bacterium]